MPAGSKAGSAMCVCRSLSWAGRHVLGQMEEGFVMKRGDRGATSIEYAMIASLIAAVVALTVGLLGADVRGLWESVSF